MKTVFSSLEELGKAWINYLEGKWEGESGRVSTRNASYEGCTFYSYATAVARYLPEKNVILCDVGSYSISTSNHVRSIPTYGSDIDVVSVKGGWEHQGIVKSSPKEIYDTVYKGALKDLEEKILKPGTRFFTNVGRVSRHIQQSMDLLDMFEFPEIPLSGEVRDKFRKQMKKHEGYFSEKQRCVREVSGEGRCEKLEDLARRPYLCRTLGLDHLVGVAAWG